MGGVIAEGGGVIVLHEAVGTISRPFVNCCNFARLQLELPDAGCPCKLAVELGVGVGMGPGVWVCGLLAWM